MKPAVAFASIVIGSRLAPNLMAHFTLPADLCGVSSGPVMGCLEEAFGAWHCTAAKYPCFTYWFPNLTKLT